MYLKSKAVAIAATVTLAGGVIAAGALTASAATPSCGSGCIDVYSELYPGSHHHPADVLDTLRQGEKVGQPQILFRTSNSDPAEDYTVTDQGTVSDFYAAGFVAAGLALHYGCVDGGVAVSGAEIPCDGAGADDVAFEIQYSPYGVDSGLCAGVGTTAASGVKVALEPCGVSSRTVWVVDSADSIHYSEVPLINGSDGNFSQPYVLTYPENSSPADKPRAQLYVSNLTGSFSAPDSIQTNQMWSAVSGVLG